MCTDFKTKIVVAQNLINDFFSNIDYQMNFLEERLYVKDNMGVRG